jgi:hypothetical protein
MRRCRIRSPNALFLLLQTYSNKPRLGCRGAGSHCKMCRRGDGSASARLLPFPSIMSLPHGRFEDAAHGVAVVQEREGVEMSKPSKPAEQNRGNREWLKVGGAPNCVKALPLSPEWGSPFPPGRMTIVGPEQAKKPRRGGRGISTSRGRGTTSSRRPLGPGQGATDRHKALKIQYCRQAIAVPALR